MKIKPLRGKKYMDYLRLCVKIASKYPKWVKGER